MNRRAALFGALAAGLFPTPPAAATPPGCVKRVFRYTVDGHGEGEFREIAWEAVRPGDRIICVGIDGDRLWCSEAYTVGAVVPAGDSVGFVRDESVNFSDNLHPFYGEKRTDV